MREYAQLYILYIIHEILPNGEQPDWLVRTHALCKLEVCMGMRLAYLLTQLRSGTNIGPTAGGVCSENAWCSRSVQVVVHVMKDQEHSDCAVPQYQYTGWNWYGD